MPIKHVFQSGDSQTTQQAKEPHISATEVEVFCRENELELNLRTINGAVVFDILSKLPFDFMQDSSDDISLDEDAIEIKLNIP